MRALILILLLAPPVLADSSAEFIKANAVEVADLADWPETTYPLLTKPRVIFVGEMHGSVEPPRAVAGIAKALKKVVVALEIWESQQTLIDGFMKTGDKRLLEASPFFRTPHPDGRSSQAMVELMESLRKIGDIPVVCFDPESGEGPGLGNQLRNTGMAFHLAAAAVKYPDRKLVVLTGNYHSMVTEATLVSGETFHPAAYLLSHLEGTSVPENEILSLRVRYAAGAAWLCLPDCGVHDFPATPSSYSQAVDFGHYALLDSAIFDGHHGTLFVRTLTASPPFPQRGEKR